MNDLAKYMTLRRMLRKPPPIRIPRLSEEAKAINCFVVTASLKTQDQKELFLLVTAVSPHELTAIHWPESSSENTMENGVTQKYPLSAFNNKDIHITHYYGIYDLTYNSLSNYWTHSLLDILSVSFIKTKRMYHMLRPLHRANRYAILKYVLAKQIEDPNGSVDAISIMQHLYDLRWLYHPDKKTLLNYYSLVLNSLEQSGEIRKNQWGQYKVMPAAISSLSIYEEEEKRHTEILGQNTQMKWITFFLFLVSLIQASIMILQLLKILQ